MNNNKNHNLKRWTNKEEKEDQIGEIEWRLRIGIIRDNDSQEVLDSMIENLTDKESKIGLKIEIIQEEVITKETISMIRIQYNLHATWIDSGESWEQIIEIKIIANINKDKDTIIDKTEVEIIEAQIDHNKDKDQEKEIQAEDINNKIISMLRIWIENSREQPMFIKIQKCFNLGMMERNPTILGNLSNNNLMPLVLKNKVSMPNFNSQPLKENQQPLQRILSLSLKKKQGEELGDDFICLLLL